MTSPFESYAITARPDMVCLSRQVYFIENVLQWILQYVTSCNIFKEIFLTAVIQYLLPYLAPFWGETPPKKKIRNQIFITSTIVRWLNMCLSTGRSKVRVPNKHIFIHYKYFLKYFLIKIKV